jgi:hypothetical protein
MIDGALTLAVKVHVKDQSGSKDLRDACSSTALDFVLLHFEAICVGNEHLKMDKLRVVNKLLYIYMRGRIV